MMYSDADEELAVAAAQVQQQQAQMTWRKQSRRDSDADAMSDDDTGHDNVLPESVIKFMMNLQESVMKGEISKIHQLYERDFNQLTEKYYKTSKWPEVETLTKYMPADEVQILYKDLYYRHIYSKLSPTFDDRLCSWYNYCELLEHFLDNVLGRSTQEKILALPSQWLWDILDEFIYQFQTYSAYLAKAAKGANKDELEAIKDNDEMWDARRVLYYLHALVSKSEIKEYLEMPAGQTPDQNVMMTCNGFSSEFARLVGYFSIVGLMRVHSLFGDYWLALKTIECLDFADGEQKGKGKPLFHKVPSCHITVFYYMGFAYMMMRRYQDAIKTFSQILLFLSRTRQFYTATYQYDNMVKKMEQMFGLLMLCQNLCPVRLDESLVQHIKDKMSDKQQKLQKGDESIYEELFQYACPKFISPAPVDMDNLDKMSTVNEVYSRQLKLFLQEVKQQQYMPTIRSYLKLYTAIPIEKLAKFLNTDEASLRTFMLCIKHKTRQPVRTGGAPLNGAWASTSDIDFHLDKDVVHVATQKQQKEYSEIFMRHIHKFADILNNANAARA